MRGKFALLKAGVAVLTATALLSGCAGDSLKLNDYSVTDIIASSYKERKVSSLAMPDGWANWGETWSDLRLLYGLEHTDTDMSSVDELDLFAKGIGDIGDVGYEYGPLAEKRGLTIKYKTSYWDDIPDWAKDNNGDWIVCYTGTLAFLENRELAGGEAAETWSDIYNASYSVAVSDVPNSSLGQYSVYAAAIANGGSADNIQPGIDFFKALAQQGRLIHNIQGFDAVIGSGAGVNIRWDFNALKYRDMALELETPICYYVCIPDASVTIGYASIINKKAANPFSAALAREYILSDEGQLNLARGYATPIRSIRLPDNIRNNRIPSDQYSDEMIANALEYSSKTAEKIIAAWNEQVMPVLNGRS